MKKIALFICMACVALGMSAQTITGTSQITFRTAGEEDVNLMFVLSNNFSDGWDNTWDAHPAQDGGIYVYYQNVKYSIWASNQYSQNLALGFKATSNTTYRLLFDAFSGVSYTITDLVANHVIAVGASITVDEVAASYYEFEIDNSLKNTAINDRFVINYEAPAPDYGSYQRNVTVGNYGTICLPKAGRIAGATLFNIGSYENDMIYIDEVGSAEMEAGKPYIFQASAAQINVTYSSDIEAIAGEANGLHGYFDALNHFDVPADAGNYILHSNQYWLVVSTRAAYLNNYYAYIKISEIQNQPAAPGRRRVGMAVNGAQVVTGIDELNAAEAPVKTVIDGKMYIIRGEHMFDATGRMVK